MRGLVAEHLAYRAKTLNLIASENAPRPEVEAAHTPELDHRYGDYLGADCLQRKYCGQRFMGQIEASVQELARELFAAEGVDLRPLGGHLAGVAVLMALCGPDDLVLELDAEAGGHRTAAKLAGARLVRLRVERVPFDGARFQVDAGALSEAIARLEPRVVLVGSACFLFPTPLEPIRRACDALEDCSLVYDASHVAGLIAGGRFQNPLAEGAQVVVASTHKTLGASQGGMILTAERAMLERLAPAVYPALVTNHHSARLPALARSLAHWQSEVGRAQATAIVRNARSLGEALERRGLRPVKVDDTYTESHTLLLVHGQAEKAARRLEECGIMAGACRLPSAWGGQGLRLGVQEVSGLGMGPGEMERVAGFVGEALAEDRSPAALGREIGEFVAAIRSRTADGG